MLRLGLMLRTMILLIAALLTIGTLPEQPAPPEEWQIGGASFSVNVPEGTKHSYQSGKLTVTYYSETPGMIDLSGLSSSIVLEEIELQISGGSDVILPGCIGLTSCYVRGGNIASLDASNCDNFTLHLYQRIGELIPSKKGSRIYVSYDGYDLAYFAGIPELTLFLSSAGDLSPLATAEDLNYLHLSGSGWDLSPLAGSQSIESVSLYYCDGVDVSPLAASSANHIVFDICTEEQLGQLIGSDSLSRLQFSAVNITDLSAILEMPALTSLVLGIGPEQVNEVIAHTPFQELRAADIEVISQLNLGAPLEPVIEYVQSGGVLELFIANNN